MLIKQVFSPEGISSHQLKSRATGSAVCETHSPFPCRPEHVPQLSFWKRKLSCQFLLSHYRSWGKKSNLRWRAPNIAIPTHNTWVPRQLQICLVVQRTVVTLTNLPHSVSFNARSLLRRAAGPFHIAKVRSRCRHQRWIGRRLEGTLANWVPERSPPKSPTASWNFV